LKEQTETLLNTISLNPYQTPPSFEKLVGDLSGAISAGFEKYLHVRGVVAESRVSPEISSIGGNQIRMRGWKKAHDMTVKEFTQLP